MNENLKLYGNLFPDNNESLFPQNEIKNNNNINNYFNPSSKKLSQQKEIKNNNIIPEVDEPIKYLTYEDPNKLLKDPKFAKVILLKEETEKEIHKTVKNANQAKFMKQLVSKDKTRFCYDGFDLDLTYITTRIIAMGFPSSSIEGLYRNPLEEVQKFFNTRHPSHYKIYNFY